MTKHLDGSTRDQRARRIGWAIAAVAAVSIGATAVAPSAFAEGDDATSTTIAVEPRSDDVPSGEQAAGEQQGDETADAVDSELTSTAEAADDAASDADGAADATDDTAADGESASGDTTPSTDGVEDAETDDAATDDAATDDGSTTATTPATPTDDDGAESDAVATDDAAVAEAADVVAVAPMADLVPITPMAALDDIITSIKLETNYPVEDGWEVRFSCTWNVGDGKAGDTFTLQLPPELEWYGSTDFDLKTPDGLQTVAEGVVNPGTGLVTFTLTPYVDTVGAVSGGCNFSTSYVATGEAGEHTVVFDVGGEIEVVINEQAPCEGECGVETARKNGWWIDPETQTRMQFQILAPATEDDGTTITFTDNPGEGYHLDCDTVRVRVSDEVESWASPRAPYSSYYEGPEDGPTTSSEPPTSVPTVNCSPDSLTVTISGVPAGHYSEVDVQGVVDDAGLDSYANTGTVQFNNQTPSEVVTHVDSSTPGGTGSGPAIHLEKWSTADGGPATLTGSDFPGDFDVAPGKALAANADEAITFTITNTGDQDLHQVVVTDSLTGGSNQITGLSCDFSLLGGPAAGTTWDGPFFVDDEFTCTGTLPGLAPGATHQDTAAVDAFGEPDLDVNGEPLNEGSPVHDDDPWNAFVPVPKIDIEKWSTADGGPSTLDGSNFPGDFDAAPGKTLVAGTPTAITFTIVNNGAEALRNVAVTDALTGGVGAITDLSCDFSALGGPATGATWAGPFAVGASFTCSGTVPAIAAGDSHADNATVSGTGVLSGVPVTDSDTWNATAPGVSGDGGTRVTTTTTVRVGVLGTSGTRSLPRTGSSSQPVAVLALLSVALGAVVLLVSKRRTVELD